MNLAVGPLLAQNAGLVAGAEGQAGQLQPLQPKGMPTVRRTGSGLDIPAEALPGRDGEFIRETPYPDSPLAAGAEGSLRDPTFFQRQVSRPRTLAHELNLCMETAALPRAEREASDLP